MGLLVLFRSTESQPTTGTAAFGQAAATWSAVGSEKLTATATFSEAAAWSATGTSILPVSATAAFAQSTVWAATVDHVIPPVSITAAFGQDAEVSAAIVLKIIGYASPAPPDEFLIVTGQLPPEEQ